MTVLLIRIMSWWYISGFSVHNEVRIKTDDEKGIENLAQYIIRNAFSLAKLQYNEGAYTKVKRIMWITLLLRIKWC